MAGGAQPEPDAGSRAGGGAQSLVPPEAWRCIGPYRGGRVVAVTGHPDDPLVFYFGACAGGVWKTADGGTTWRNISDGFFRTAAVGALAIAPSDPNVLYAGMGETCIRGNVSHGDGVYRSRDGGATWEHVGLRQTRHIAKIRVDPRNPDLVYVAALGHVYGPNNERGLYRSRDGGSTWQQLLVQGGHAGAIDLSMDPLNPRILYAALWDVRRNPYRMISGGPGSGLYRSNDGGDHWTELTHRPGLPTGVLGKIGIAASPVQSGRVWAMVEARDGALFCSDDGGETWERRSEDGELRRRAWYYMHVCADPTDADTVWVLNVQCWKSIDGGHTFASVPTPHGDNHDLWIDPRNPRRMIDGNDGGACVSYNGAETWSTIDNQPTAQFYHVIADEQTPYRVYGSQQDNSAISLPSMSADGAITVADWERPGGGESGYIAVRPDDPRIVVGGAIGSGPFNGRLIRYDRRTGQQRNITVWPEFTGMGYGAQDLKHRFQWTFPVFYSRHEPGTLYVAANRVFRSRNDGASWEIVSPDLSRNDPSTLEPSGGAITKDNTGAEVYGTIFALVESATEAGTFWAGTDDGLVQISRDGCQTWRDVTPPSLPTRALISIIELSPHDPATAYVAATRYKWDDVRPYLLKSSDYGATWKEIVGGLQADDFTRVIRADPVQPGLLFCGTETAVAVSLDDGESWQSLQGNLPVVPMYDLAISGNDLIAATHGRSFWILDDMSALRQLAAENATDAPRGVPPRLFAPSTVTRYRAAWNPGKLGKGKRYRMAGALVVCFDVAPNAQGEPSPRFFDAGQNPPLGAVISYRLPLPNQTVKLAFFDDSGNQLVSFDSRQSATVSPDQPTPNMAAMSPEGAEAGGAATVATEGQPPHVPNAVGMNRFVWNLRVRDAERLPGDTATEELLAGPMVPPGRYRVVLSVGDVDMAEALVVRKDPRADATDRDLQEQYELLLKIRDKLSETHRAVLALRELRRQLDHWETATRGAEQGRTIALLATTLGARLAEIAGELVQEQASSPLGYPSRLNQKLAVLATFVDSADAAPAAQADAVFDDLSARIDRQLARLRSVIATDIPAFNAQLSAAQIAGIVPPALGS